MGMIQEFRDFALKGNVVDLAVGVIIGGAFGKIVDSLVKDIVMPIVGGIFGNVDFSNMFTLMGKIPADYKGAMTYADLSKAGVPMLAYGNFITILINFLILAFVIFMLVRYFNSMKAAEPAPAPAAPAASEIYLKEIRDALAKK
jgi:large conductance mechanosensitive channel